MAISNTLGRINDIWMCMVASIIVFSNAECCDAITFMHKNYHYSCEIRTKILGVKGGGTCGSLSRDSGEHLGGSGSYASGSWFWFLISRLWDRAPHQAPCSVRSLHGIFWLPLPLPLFLCLHVLPLPLSLT